MYRQLLARNGLFVIFFPMLFYRSPPRIPQVHIPEEPVLQVASALCVEINGAFVVLRSIAAGKDLKKFLIVCFLYISSLLFLQVHPVFEVDHLILLLYFDFSRIILITATYGSEIYYCRVLHYLINSIISGVHVLPSLTNYIELDYCFWFTLWFLKLLVCIHVRLSLDCGSCQLWGVGAISWPCFIYVWPSKLI